MSKPDNFYLIADQDPSFASIGRKLDHFYHFWAREGGGVMTHTHLPTGYSQEEIDAAHARGDSEAELDMLEDLIATVSRRCAGPYTVGWHPDYSNTLVYAHADWFLGHGVKGSPS